MDEKRVFFTKPYELPAEGSRVLYRPGCFYHVPADLALELIAAGIANDPDAPVTVEAPPVAVPQIQTTIAPTSAIAKPAPVVIPDENEDGQHS